LWQLVEKEIHGGNSAIAGNDEISPGLSRRFAWAARYPSDSPAIAQFLGISNYLISKLRVGGFDLAAHAINFVSAVVDGLGFVEHAVFGENLVDDGSSARGIVLTKDVVKIACQ
jgi:hypothetical protein